MAFGSFSPFWKPHGMGQSRWPLDRGMEAQQAARMYGELRYKLMPYTYTYAHEAATAGTPLARAMVLEFQSDPQAWKHDLQYMWGREMLVAPDCSDDSSVAVWLPDGTWYDFWTDSTWLGNQQYNCTAHQDLLPLFVKAGSIIPMAQPALSTAFIRKDQLTVHVYVGKDGAFTLYEDDGISDSYRIRGEMRTTRFTFIQSIMALDIRAATGSYEGAPASRVYRIEFHGLSNPVCMNINNRPIKFVGTDDQARALGEGIVWDKERKLLSVFTQRMPVDADLLIRAHEDCDDEKKQ
jgi:alpha-D-xyloside xylohydrolase